MIDPDDLPESPAGEIDAESVASRRFLTGVRGYVREEVHAYLRAVADAIRARDEKILRLQEDLERTRATGGTPLANVVAPEVRDLIDSADRLSTGIKLHAHGQMLKAYRSGSSLLSVIEDARARFEIAESAITEALRTVMDGSRGLVPAPPAPGLEAAIDDGAAAVELADAGAPLTLEGADGTKTIVLPPPGEGTATPLPSDNADA